MNSAALLVALTLAAEPTVAPNVPAPSAPSTTAPVLTLDQALKATHENNLDLQAAREKVAQAGEGWRKVLANYLPQISLGASYTRNQYEAKFSMPTGYWLRDMSGYPAGAFDRTGTNGPDYDPTKGAPSIPDNPPGQASTTVMVPSGMAEMYIQKYDQLGLRLQLNQAIVVPALWPAFNLADLGAELATMSVENVRREMLFGVTQLYYGCVTLKEVIGIREKTLANTIEHERDAKVRVDAGALPKIMLIRAQIDRSKAERDLDSAKLAYQGAKIALGTLLGQAADFEVVRPEEPKLPEGTDLVAAAEKDRLDLQVARLSRDLASKSKDATWYKYLPSVIGQATYQVSNVSGFSGSGDAWALGLALSWTLWDGGLREVELRENQSKLKEAELSLKSAQLKARDEVRRALLDLETARSNRIKAEETVKLARENMQLVDVNFRAGAATQIDVSDATTQLAGAELAVVTESLNAEMAALKLVKASGGFNPQFK